MTEQEFSAFQKLRHVITVDDLTDKSNRTLLYGYNRSSNSSNHVYIHDGNIYAVFSQPTRLQDGSAGLQIPVNSNSDYIQRGYTYNPQYCDAEFVGLLVKQFLSIPMQAYRKPQGFASPTSVYRGSVLSHHVQHSANAPTEEQGDKHE